MLVLNSSQEDYMPPENKVEIPVRFILSLSYQISDFVQQFVVKMYFTEDGVNLGRQSDTF